LHHKARKADSFEIVIIFPTLYFAPLGGEDENENLFAHGKV